MITRSQDLLRGVDVPRVAVPTLVSTLAVKRVSDLSAEEQSVNYSTLSPDDEVFPVFHLAGNLALRIGVSSSDNAISGYRTFLVATCTAEALAAEISSAPNISAVITSGKLVISATHSSVTALYISEYEALNHVRATDPRAPLFRYAAPDARGGSAAGNVQPPAPRRDAEVSAVTAGVARYEERTSASLNRGLTRITDNMDKLDDELDALVESHVRAPYRVDGQLSNLSGYLTYVHPLKPIRLVNEEGIPIERAFPGGERRLVGSELEVTGYRVDIELSFDPVAPVAAEAFLVDESTLEFILPQQVRHFWMPLEINRGGVTYTAVTTEWYTTRRVRIKPYRRYLDHMPALALGRPLRADVAQGERVSVTIHPSPYVDSYNNLSVNVPAELVLPEGDLYVTFTQVLPLNLSGERARSLVYNLSAREYAPPPMYNLAQAVIRSRSPFDNAISPDPIVSQHAIRNAGIGGVRVGELGAGHTEIAEETGKLLFMEDVLPVNPSVLRASSPVYIRTSGIPRDRRGYGDGGAYPATFFVRDRTLRSVFHAFSADDAGRLLRVFFPTLQQSEYATITRVLSPELVETDSDIPALYNASTCPVSFTYATPNEYTAAHRAGALFIAAEDAGVNSKHVQVIEGLKPRLSYSGARSAPDIRSGRVASNVLTVFGAAGYATPSTSSGIFSRRIILLHCAGNVPGFSVLSTDCTAVGDDLRVTPPFSLPDGDINVTLTSQNLIEVAESSGVFVNTLYTPTAHAQASISNTAIADTAYVATSVKVGTAGALNVTTSRPSGGSYMSNSAAPRVGESASTQETCLISGAWESDAAVCVSGGVNGYAGMSSGAQRGSEVTVSSAGALSALRARDGGTCVYTETTSKRSALSPDGLHLSSIADQESYSLTANTIKELHESINVLYDNVHKLKVQNEALHSAALLMYETIKNLTLLDSKQSTQLVSWGIEDVTSNIDDVFHVRSTTTPIEDRRVRISEVLVGTYRALLSSKNCALQTYKYATGAGDEETFGENGVLYGVIGTGLRYSHDLGYEFFAPVQGIPVSALPSKILYGVSDTPLVHRTNWHPLREPLNGQELPVDSDVKLYHRAGVIPHRTLLASGARASNNTEHECPPIMQGSNSVDIGLFTSPLAGVNIQGVNNAITNNN